MTLIAFTLPWFKVMALPFNTVAVTGQAPVFGLFPAPCSKGNDMEILIHVRDQWAAQWVESDERIGWRNIKPDYYLGKEPPNYPVPSIVTESSLWLNCYMLFKSNDTEPFKMWFKN